MKKWSLWMVMAALTILPISIFALLKWYRQEYMQLPVKGGETHRIADFALTNQFGEPVTLRNWENKIVVADFFFTHCPVICLLVLIDRQKRIRGYYNGTVPDQVDRLVNDIARLRTE
ncbi:MAG: hypothetical protein EON98_16340 [Chitinophagaceae bacterium]|nr:MAG: hypothetical protein EON98_16340 [Chitinophagaceae bacterium]